MQKTKSIILAAGLAAICTSAFANPSPTGQEILKKVAAAQKAVKTYQAIMTVNTSSKSFGSMILRVDFKSVPGGKYATKTMVVGTPTGQLAMLGSFANSTVIDDGKSLWTYNPAMKSYAKRESIITKGQPFNLTSSLAQQSPDNITLVGETPLEGKPTYAIRIADPKSARKGQPTMTVYVDKGTSRVKRTEMVLKQKSPDGKSTEDINIVMNVESEKTNAAIPESAFKFVPPPGAKEVAGSMLPSLPSLQGGKNK